MTVHSAKGLEYDTVFITGFEDGMFPLIHDDKDDVEEERRLLYVAITRAKRMLYITHARDRMRFGSHEMRMKSRFLEEIPEECIEESDTASFSNKKIQQLESNIRNRKNNLFVDKTEIIEKEKPKLKSDDFELGDKIMHTPWGKGTVVQIKDNGDDKIIVIAFENKGIKNLSLKHAPIEKI